MPGSRADQPKRRSLRLPSFAGLTAEQITLSDTKNPWPLLIVANTFRLIIGLCLFTLSLVPDFAALFNKPQTQVFFWLGLSILLLSILWRSAINRRWPSFQLQSGLQIAADLAAIISLTALLGMDSGIGVLLIIPVFLCSLIMRRWTAYLAAAIAYLALLFIQVYALLSGSTEAVNYSQLGALGLVFFITAFVGHLAAQRNRINEARARAAGVDVRNANDLNRHIIGDMDTPVLVVDPDQRVRLVNHAAKRLLNRQLSPGTPLARGLPVLAKRLNSWQAQPNLRPPSFEINQRHITPAFRALGRDRAAGTLIYLEDAEQINARVQQAKLAALGQLTASIAHEVRNPLAAIAQANQLLGESAELNTENQQLTGMISRNAERMNRVIENVLRLSRREQTQAEAIALPALLEKFVSDFSEAQQWQSGQISLYCEPNLTPVYFDRAQLEQILNSLCSNAIKHAAPKPSSTAVPLSIAIHVQQQGDQIQLQLCDNGPGVASAVRDRIFEPFFSTVRDSSGLGLYIIRELCEANQARIELAKSINTPSTTQTLTGCCFIIYFSSYSSQQPQFQAPTA